MLVTLGLSRLGADRDGLKRTDARAGATPVTVLEPESSEDDARRPAVVVAHGFAGARELMQALSLTLARNGYVVVSFDFPGHGDHPEPLGGSLGSSERVASLRRALADAVAHARGLDGVHSELGLLGHSMAGDILIRHALDDPEVTAVVGLSPYIERPPPPDALSADLLVAYGGLEADMLVDLGRAAVAPAAGLPPDRNRRLERVPGAEHIGILFAPHALSSSVRWLDRSFGFERDAPIQLSPRRLGLIAYYLGVMLLGFVLAGRLPVVTDPPLGAGVHGRRFALVALVPPVATPVILAALPTDVVPSLLTDYVAFHFLLYGVLTLSLTQWVGAPVRAIGRGLRPAPFLLALVGVLGFELLTLGYATDRLLSQFFPGPNRLGATLLTFTGAAVWLIGDEHLTRGPGAPRLAVVATKAGFLASLVFAVVLDPGELFFLMLIVPAVLILFVVFGLLGGWIHRRTGHPLVAALAHALAFALAIAATFPVVA